MSYELISQVGRPDMYQLLRELVDAHHEEVRGARITLAWCTSWNPDVDGRVTLGMCKKATDLSRELAPFDFIILLSRSFWGDNQVTDEQRRALLDHELCHCAVVVDKDSEPKVDERGRTVFRIRKHDIEEFAEIVERHGTYKRDLEHFAAALRRSAHDPFQPCEHCRDTPGWVPVDGGTVQRCACFLEWQTRRRNRTEDFALTGSTTAPVTH